MKSAADSLTRPAFLLLSGRTAGFVASFAIPLVLARRLSPDAFGTYREVFLIYATLYGLAQLGMAESLYYFIPRWPGRASRAIANATVALAGAGLAGGAVVWLSAPWTARWFHNASLRAYLPALGVFLALMLVASTLEIIQISSKRFRLAAATYAGSDALRATLMVVPVLIWHSLAALMIGVIVFALVRCLVLVGHVRRAFGSGVRMDAGVLRTQWAYALPFAASVTVEIIQANLHQFAVAAWFDRATFAVYSVGCLQIPLVDLLATSASNVMMVRMGEDLVRGASATDLLALWHRTVERLALVFLPGFVLVALTAHEIITTLFTARYEASVPVFVVSSITVALAALPVDSALRVYAETRTLLGLSLLRLALIAGSIAWFVSRWSLPGAVLVTVMALATTKAIAVWRIARLMRVDWSDALPWRALGRTAAAAALALIPAVAIHMRLPPPLVLRAVATGVVYGAAYLAGLGAMGGLKRSPVWPWMALDDGAPRERPQVPRAAQPAEE